VSAQPGSFVLTHVTVIDTSNGHERRDTTLVVTADRVVSLGRRARVPTGALVIDGAGKFVIPGLWDMHVHVGSYDDATKVFPALIASGITGIRDMGSPLDDVLRLRHDVERGMVVGPHMAVAGPLLNGPLPFHNPMILSVSTPADARGAVDRLRAAGVDYVKVHDALRAAEFDAIAAEAHRLNLPFAGHVPPSTTVEHATDAGQRSIEHFGGRFYGVMLGCSRGEADASRRIHGVVDAALAALAAGREPDDSAIFHAEITRPIAEGYDPLKAAALLRRFSRNHTWQCPTLVALPLPDALLTRKDLSPDDLTWGRLLVERMKGLIPQMIRAGVGVLAGTDAPLDRPRLHDELALLVEAGLTPLEALQTATTNPARFLGRESDFGTVAPRKVADFVILDADPLEDISNTRRVSAVVLRGRYIKTTGVVPPAVETLRRPTRPAAARSSSP
jgi:imidazolonepropionase-like amidohydrolase